MRYEITKLSYIGGQLRNPGEVIEFDGDLSGNVAIPLDDTAAPDVVEAPAEYRNDEPELEVQVIAENPAEVVEAAEPEKVQETGKPKGKR